MSISDAFFQLLGVFTGAGRQKNLESIKGSVCFCEPKSGTFGNLMIFDVAPSDILRCLMFVVFDILRLLMLRFYVCTENGAPKVENHQNR